MLKKLIGLLFAFALPAFADFFTGFPPGYNLPGPLSQYAGNTLSLSVDGPGDFAGSESFYFDWLSSTEDYTNFQVEILGKWSGTATLYINESGLIIDQQRFYGNGWTTV